MTREEFLEKYERGYVKVSFDEWLMIAHCYPGKMISPGGVAHRFGITRTAVLKAARRGKVWYFVAHKTPWQHGYVLVADLGLEKAFGTRGRTGKGRLKIA